MTLLLVDGRTTEFLATQIFSRLNKEAVFSVSPDGSAFMDIQRMWTPAKNQSRKPRFPYPVARATLLALLAAGALYVGIELAPPEPRSEPASPPPARQMDSALRPKPTEPPERPLAEPALAAAPEEGCTDGCTTRKPGCAIKGNISPKTGERIYHLPSQRFYERTVISPEDGERWFCTEAEAVANGWRRSKV